MKKLLLLVIFILFFAGCEDLDKNHYEPKYTKINPNNSDKHLIFGIHPLHNPKRLFEVYQPLVNYLNKNIPDVKIKLESSKNYASYNKKLYSGHFDLALPNPYQTVKSLEHGYKVFGKMSDDFNFRGIILTRKDSNIKDFKDLKGKTISYPAPTALAATMMPQYYLYENGINVTKDLSNIYVGSQESSIMSVYLKKSQAASTWPPPWIAFSKERPDIAKELEIKWQTHSLPNNGLVAKDTLDSKTVKKLSEILFSLHESFEGQEILKAIELSKFELANEDTYKPVISFLKKFEDKVRVIEEKK